MFRINILDAHESSSLQNIINRLNQLNVSVKIHPAVVIEDPKACIIAHKSVFLSSISLADIGNAIDIKVGLVPLLDLIAWHIPPPALNALDSTSRQRIPPKPTIMNHPWYHLTSNSPQGKVYNYSKTSLRTSMYCLPNSASGSM